MSEKLEQLTKKLYHEGIEKANNEAEEIKKKAQSEAEEIIAKAKAEANKILKQAEQEAEKLDANVKTELKQASSKIVNNTKQKITDLVLLKVIDENVKKAFNEIDFMKSLIESSVKAWTEQSATIVIPESKKAELDTFLAKTVAGALKGGLTVKYDSKIDSGFQLLQREGNFKINFTDKDFSNLYKSILKENIVKILFE